MKFIQWLDKKGKDKIPERDEGEKAPKKAKKKSVLEKKIYEVENGVIDITAIEVDVPEDETPKFIHEETGKEYKSERALKAAITRYNKKNGNNTQKKTKDEDSTEQFIDEESGKVYKTEAALKAAKTRRLKKQQSDKK